MEGEPCEKKRRRKRKKRKNRISVFCHCGKEQKMGNRDDTFSCGSECLNTLYCGHQCNKICHEGTCSPCAYFYTKSCSCGKMSRDILCGEDDQFQCNLTCERALNCGKHVCKSTCHSPPCSPCALLPSKIRFCHCGKTPLCKILASKMSRIFCTDPIPTCGLVCGKLLDCPTFPIAYNIASRQHKCTLKCHKGPCPPCYKNHNIHSVWYYTRRYEGIPGVGLQYLQRFKPDSGRAYFCTYFPRKSRKKRNEEYIEYVKNTLRKFVTMVLEQFQPHQEFTLHFKTTSSYRRRIIHILAPKYGCTSLSHGAPPNRHTIITTSRWRAMFPPPESNSARSFIMQDSIFLGNRFYKRAVVIN